LKKTTGNWRKNLKKEVPLIRGGSSCTVGKKRNRETGGEGTANTPQKERATSSTERGGEKCFLVRQSGKKKRAFGKKRGHPQKKGERPKLIKKRKRKQKKNAQKERLGPPEIYITRSTAGGAARGGDQGEKILPRDHRIREVSKEKKKNFARAAKERGKLKIRGGRGEKQEGGFSRRKEGGEARGGKKKVSAVLSPSEGRKVKKNKKGKGDSSTPSLKKGRNPATKKKKKLLGRGN